MNPKQMDDLTRASPHRLRRGLKVIYEDIGGQHNLIMRGHVGVGLCCTVTNYIDVENEIPDLMKQYEGQDFDTVLAWAIPEFVKQDKSLDRGIPPYDDKAFFALIWCALNNPINGEDVCEAVDHILGYTLTMPELIWESPETHRRGADNYKVEVVRVNNPFVKKPTN